MRSTRLVVFLHRSPAVHLIDFFGCKTGDVLSEKWHCPVCPDNPVLQSVSLIGQVVQCGPGCYTACTRCPFPTRFFESGLVCASCTKADRVLEERLNAEKHRCWFDGCCKGGTCSFLAVPFGGLEEGETWETLWACTSHTFPGHLTKVPIPRDEIKRMWWRWNKEG